MRTSKERLGRERGDSSVFQGLSLFDAWALCLDGLTVTSGLGVGGQAREAALYKTQ